MTDGQAGGPTTRRRATAIVAAGVAVTATILASLASAPGSAARPSDKTIPTLPTGTEASLPSAPEPSAESTAPPSSAAVPLPEIDLHPNASATELVAAASRLLNDGTEQTDDIAADLAPLVPVPFAFRSPVDVTITRASVAYHDSGVFTALVDFTSPASPADLVLFFETTLVGSSYVENRAPVVDGGITMLSYSRPDVPAESTSLLVIDVSGQESGEESGEESGGFVSLALTEPLDSSVLAAFTGWAPGIPLPESGQLPTSARFYIERGASGRPVVNVETTYAFSDLEPDELVEAFTAGLEESPYAVDEAGGGVEGPGSAPVASSDPESATLIHLTTGQRLTDLVATIAPADDGSTLRLTGAVQF